MQLGTNTVAKPEEAVQAPIDRSLTDLGSSIDYLAQSLKELQSRLEPVLTPRDSSPPDGATPRPMSGHVVNVLTDHNDRVLQLKDQVTEILDRLEV